MNKYKYLLQNTLLFALSGILVKILSFFMLPLYTNILTTAEYGTVELMNTTITLLTPFLSLSIAEAVIRFLVQKQSDKKTIFSTSLLIIVTGTVVLVIAKPLIAFFSTDIDKYFIYFVIMYFVSTLETMLFNFAKGLEKIKACSINAVIIVLVTVFTNLLLLLKFEMGLEGYLIAIIAAQATSSLYLGIICKVWRFLKPKKIDNRVVKEMLLYSIPIIPSSIAWWMNSAFDRYMIVYMLGIAANGIFSAASKLPATINVITSVFNQAWQLSGVKEYGEKDYDSFFSNVYNMYNAVMVTAVTLLIPLSPLLAKFLFSGEFYEAWKYAPILYISTLFSGLNGVLASVFCAVKKTSFLMKSTIAGAVINVCFNYVLIKYIGIQGAGIATMISFFAVWVIRISITKRFIDLNVKTIRSVLVYIILIVQVVVVLGDSNLKYVINILLILLIMAVNISEYKKMVKYCFKTVSKMANKNV